ncbi:hypothetical protein ACNF40_06595 [Cuniculiplasma sp. SKW4]|uniref:hypothetical protein n=1 Tax=Cuniculiplasma sp. SKW4 TaxID=3400171 RepID=UPI003FD185E6
MSGGKTVKGKDPKRVIAGKKAWVTRLKKERDAQIREAGESIIPGYGYMSHIGKALKTQMQIDKEKRRKTRKRK